MVNNLDTIIAKQKKTAAIHKVVELSAKMKKQSLCPSLDLVIPYDVFHAFLALHGNTTVKEIIKQCRITIESGAKVYFVTNFVNAPRQINHIFQTQADVDVWESQMITVSKGQDHMKDSELRAIVLKQFYERRRDITPKWGERCVPQGIDARDFFLICNRLSDYNLISWKPYEKLQNGILGGIGTITAFGVDVVEGTQRSPITITFDQSIKIENSSNVQLGNNNAISTIIDIERLNAAIGHSRFSTAEKQEAKNLLNKFLEHPLVTSVLGGISGGLVARSQ